MQYISSAVAGVLILTGKRPLIYLAGGLLLLSVYILLRLVDIIDLHCSPMRSAYF